MSLSSRDRELVEAGREGLEPSSDDRRRLRGAIAAQIGVAATVAAASAGATGAATTTATGAAGSGGAATGGAGVISMKGLAVLVLVVGAGAGAFTYGATQGPLPAAHEQEHAQGPGRVASAAASESPMVVAPAVEPPTLASAPEPTAVSPVAVGLPAPSASKPTRKAPSAGSASPAVEPAEGALTRETRLVAEAREALRAGEAGRALALLEEHARRFPGGVLAAEREAERVTALCALGRSAEARAHAARFSREHPSSALGARVRAACAGP